MLNKTRCDHLNGPLMEGCDIIKFIHLHASAEGETDIMQTAWRSVCLCPVETFVELLFLTLSITPHITSCAADFYTCLVSL